jgi:hypothetical protein
MFLLELGVAAVALFILIAVVLPWAGASLVDAFRSSFLR